jgi:hypothetical protein
VQRRQSFPLHLWDRLIPQAEISLNLLRGSRINPKLSAWAQIHGNFDFNRTPLGPPGTRVLAHDKPDARTTWSPHALDGWYVGPAMESYRCHRVWIWETRATRICDTLTWFPTHVPMPASSSTDIIIASLRDIVTALQNPSPQTPLAPCTDTQNQALLDVVTLLTNLTPTPTESVAAPPLRVVTPGPGTPGAPPLRVVPTKPASENMPTSTPENRPKDNPAPTPEDNTRPPPEPIPKPTPDHIPTPTPEPIPTPTPDPTPENIPAPTPAPIHAQPQDPVPDITYEQVTGPSGRRRRQRQRKPKVAANNQPIASKPGIRLSARKIGPVRTANARPNPRPAAKRTILALLATTIPNAPGGNHWALHGTAINPDTGAIAEYRELSKCRDGHHWQTSNEEEVGRMFQGLGPESAMPTGTNTLFFIDRDQVPKHKRATYIRVVCADRPEKSNTRRVRWTAGGDKIEYHGSVTTKTADITTAKLLFNSVLSTPEAKFMMIDLKYFYLCSDLDVYEYVRIPAHMLSPRIIALYKLEDKIRDGYVYAEVRKGMYGLPQASKLANDRLRKFLAPAGYLPCTVTPGLWRHQHSNLMFSLVVDDFGIRYTNRDDVDQLLAVLQTRIQMHDRLGR